YDGANIEIVECAGEENNYIFGAKVDELARLRPHYDPRNVYDSNPNVRRAVDSLVDGSIANDPDSARVFREIWNSLLTGDWRKPDYYFNLYDFEDYVDTKLRAIYDTKNEREFARKCLLNTVNAGKFSSDRTIREYANEIWHIKRNDPDGIM
ncbi:MAG: glycogen/starch/alpha-glucan phosphorylase, partial [Clostridia bacterium]|nr:glycogen/starch/alpha-glucan phosphorylase [Clostridia bacterium]